MPTSRLPRDVRVLVAGDALSALGNGMLLPLLLVYLHEVRGLPLATTGLLLTLEGAAGLVAVPLVGVALDRFGGRRVLVALTALCAVAQAGLAEIHGVASGVPVLMLLGVVQGSTFPAYTTLLAGMTRDPILQQRAFAINFTGINAGVGVGALLSGLVASIHHPLSFELLFVADAVTSAGFAVVLALLPDVGPRPGEAETATGTYRDVVRDRSLRLVVLTSLLLAVTGYASLDSGLPAYATVEAHLSVRVVGVGLTINTVLIVAGQLVVLRLIRRWRRSRALAAVGMLWTLAWILFSLSALPLGTGGRIACVLAFTAVFGIGETFMAPTIGPLLNSLAGDHIRGRANALSSSMYGVAFVVAPSLATGLIALGLPLLWIGLLVLGCLGVVVLAVTLRRNLPAGLDRIAEDPEPRPEPSLAEV